ncbi:SsrA-binding protein [Candidatus Campbellbacteria bacterium CG11_big_fil_rev_8_21_14_0_20_44_21]|uniref:SsrA-binding protein n=1 Tax=Candidatus Campbellbacteria bacterium CG22_combo_CG10-13_8_21_14_all_43_18 TaxID=1974530 RepID=A0A2H0DW89_9BACT|nr:MAG: SsrA-binding protein [Candidatus Campbellbacteria bacterium CG22_combo_CG10-13_8_21_14_all_43_18]PIR24390.1 MAG: SsrA-binding protein [Candidatus Campbellbacteria bacterium CG11_big_fil_rev_8_21_14_0_20_44_21]
MGALYLKNKKAAFNFEIIETIQAGLELLGLEVKSLRDKKGNLEGGRVVVRGSEAYLVGVTIPPYQAQNTPKGYDPERPRKLLLRRKEISRLAGLESKKGLTILPISVYNKGRNLKLEIGIARGKKKFDKRQSIKKEDARRDVEREVKFKFR